MSKDPVRCRTEQLKIPQLVDVVQGLWGTTLVAGKSTSVRIYFTNGVKYTSSKKVRISITRPNGSAFAFTWNLNKIVRVPKSPNVIGPSLVVTVPGEALPFVGLYYFRVDVFDNSGGVIQNVTLDAIPFLPTMDLRMIFDVNYSPPRPGEIQVGREGIKRMAEIFPLRDGLGNLDSFGLTGGAIVTKAPLAGFRYEIVNWTDAHVCEPENLPTWRQKPPILSFDFYFSYRFTYYNEGDGGGLAGLPECGSPDRKYAHAEDGISANPWPFGMIFSQETAHLLGIERERDTVGNRNPFFDPSGQGSHSRNEYIDAISVERGFNVAYNRPWPSTIVSGDISFENQVYDAMYAYVSRANVHERISFNWFDWEHIRQRLMTLPSTGPEAPISLRANWELSRILSQAI